MTTLATRAEIVKLARELMIEPDDIAFLEGASPEALRQFRNSVRRQIDAPHKKMLGALAKASSLIPNSISATIATRHFGPMLCGMVAAELPPEKAKAMIGHLDVDFLADVCPYIDPDAATPIIRTLDTSVMEPVMKVLLSRKDYVTMARFIGALTEAQLRAIVPLVESGKDILMAAFNAEDMNRFDVVLADLPVTRLRGIIQAAVDNDLFVETLTVLGHVSDSTLARIADAATDLGPEVLAQLVESTYRAEAFTEFLPLARVMSADKLPILANLDVWQGELLTASLRSADTAEGREAAARLVGAIDNADRRAVAERELAAAN